MLDTNIIEQLRSIFGSLNSSYTLKVESPANHENRSEMVDLVEGVASSSDKIEAVIVEGEQLRLSLLKDSVEVGVSFRAIPSGHEFNSLLLAILNCDGVGKNLPDSFTIERIKALKGEISLTTYMMLDCTKCPDVIQALNIMAMYNPNITHEAVDGAINLEEVRGHNVHAVPAVFVGDENIHVGRGNLGELLNKLEERFGTEGAVSQEQRNYDVVVLGGGPAGATSAIYLARKGVKVAVVADKIGGQVNDTVGIENITSIAKTTGQALAANLRTHLEEYDIDILDNRVVESITKTDDGYLLKARGGESYHAPRIVVATGAQWRKLNIPGEEQYLGRGISFCPHCDGPFFKDKMVSVIGGGNSGIEVAIDLARICTKVTVLEFMPELKADKVLQDLARSTSNIEIITNTETVKIRGDQKSVTSIVRRDRESGQEHEIELSGVFIQVGLLPNSQLLEGLVDINKRGEIVTDGYGRTLTSGIYAVGDVTDVLHKQIVIAMGEGAKGALSVFEDIVSS